MHMLLTTLGLLLVTILCVLHHLRSRPMPRKSVAVPTGSPCGRCRTSVPSGAAYCPGCGVAQRLARANSATRKPAKAQRPPAPPAGRKASKLDRDVRPRLGVPGDDLDKVRYEFTEPAPLRGKRLLVIGGGDHAVDTALRLARQADTRVFLSHSEECFARLDARNAEGLTAAVKTGRIKLLLKSRVREIRQDAVILEVDGRVGRLPNDDVIVRLEGDPPPGLEHPTSARIGANDVPSPNREVASAS